MLISGIYALELLLLDIVVDGYPNNDGEDFDDNPVMNVNTSSDEHLHTIFDNGDFIFEICLPKWEY